MVYGCMDLNACNYNSEANMDDGLCDYESCAGCMDSNAFNYDPDALIDDGSCLYSITQTIDLSPFTFNNISFNVIPNNLLFSAIVGDLSLLLGVNGSSENYVPDYRVEKIGKLNVSEGKKLLING